MAAQPQSDSHTDIVIIGGGIAGLSSAWALQRAGLSVTVIDAGTPTTPVAAGMLAAGMELEPSEQALLTLTLAAQAQWPGFRDALETATGADLGYRDEGTLFVALTRDDAMFLRQRHTLLRGAGLDVDLLPAEAIGQREAQLSPRAPLALYRAADHQVDPIATLAALRQAFTAAGAAIIPGKVTALTRVNDIWQAETDTGETHRAARVVLAAGAWSGMLDGLPRAARPPVRPIKGQSIVLQMDPAQPLIRHVVWSRQVYLAPRADGRLIIGGTVEERGFDASPTAGGLLALLEAAWRLVPGIEDLPIVETPVGFRPGSPDDAPIIGAGPMPGLFYATGQYRNGILLAPAMASALADAVGGAALPSWAAPFTIDRFATADQEAAA